MRDASLHELGFKCNYEDCGESTSCLSVPTFSSLPQGDRFKNGSPHNFHQNHESLFQLECELRVVPMRTFGIYLFSLR